MFLSFLVRFCEHSLFISSDHKRIEQKRIAILIRSEVLLARVIKFWLKCSNNTFFFASIIVSLNKHCYLNLNLLKLILHNSLTIKFIALFYYVLQNEFSTITLPAKKPHNINTAMSVSNHFSWSRLLTILIMTRDDTCY